MDKILIQLDADERPSTFDRVVAIDAGAQHVFSYGGITPENVVPLVHGAIFTRGPKDLKHTAIFVGGSDVAAGEAVYHAVRKALIPAHGLSVSVMLDSNGSNTTAAAAVRAAAKHLDLAKARALILGGTGPVGQRIARLLAKLGTHVRLGSRQKTKAEEIATSIRASVSGAGIEAVATAGSSDAPSALAGRDLVFAAGAAGVVLLPKKYRTACPTLKVAIDLNGVPPAGIEGIEAMDKGMEREGVICYGALGVGGAKMKLHKAAIGELFARNDAAMDTDAIYSLAEKLG